jgi:hypothetical protein
VLTGRKGKEFSTDGDAARMNFTPPHWLVSGSKRYQVIIRPAPGASAVCALALTSSHMACKVDCE